MPRRLDPALSYRAIRIEGGLLPAEELTRLALLADPAATEQRESDYRLPKGLKLRDEIARDFKIALNLWQDFLALRQRQDLQAQEITLREWLLPLLRDVLHFVDLAPAAPSACAGHQYPIGYAGNGGRVPLVLASFDEALDRPVERFGDTDPHTGRSRRRSPFLLAQEVVNASDASLWAIVANGLTLRILRQNPSLTRPAYIEVDLEVLFNEELLADFSAFWLLAHASRFGSADAMASDCPWERWRAAAQQAGVAVREKLRYRVADALRALGTGFLRHPANGALRTKLQDPHSGYTGQIFFEELLRLVYRLIFLATVEDRRDPGTGQALVFTPDASDAAKTRYLAGYSLTWLRERSLRRSQHDRHSDLWQALGITFASLARGEPALGLPALGGLFAADQCPELDTAQLHNRYLLEAIFQLGWFRSDGGLSRVNYRDMGPEELGSVYESLLEIVPELQGLNSPATARLAFLGDDADQASARGSTRKLTGSYYTPDSLVQELIKSALEPAIAQTIQANPQDPVAALLSLTICDPACGSGHFLLAAARRLADEVALHRAAALRPGAAPTPADYRHALRDVVGRCLYGVDKNPMAIQLSKTALWLEAYSPDRPLSFIDHHLRVGDALLGILDPEILEAGIPDAAYNALSGDEKDIAKALKRENKAQREAMQQLSAGNLLSEAGIVAKSLRVEELGDDSLTDLAAKRAAWSEAEEEARRSPFARMADAYLAAFLMPKAAETQGLVPLTADLWTIRNGQPMRAGVEDAAERTCRAQGVLHWWLAFPRIADQGGFSVMLGNPPWEQLQLSEEEFFASRAPSVAALAGAKRKEAIAKLRFTAPWLWTQFNEAKRTYEVGNLYFRAGGRFPLSAFGKLNTYALFAETFLQATAPQGRAGFIVPTGIATDDSTKAYFGHLASHGRLASLFDFENREAVFPAIDSRIKFSLLTLGTAAQAEFVCFATRIDHLHDPRRRFTLAAADFALINPNTRTCPVFRSTRDAELTKKLYRAAPVLIREAVTDVEGKVLEPEVNPWAISFSQGLFNMTSDSGLFHDAPTAPGQPQRLPLYEAKMIHQFDHRWATYVDAAGEGRAVDVTDAQKADPAFTVQPRYWVDEREVLARIARVPARVARAWRALHATRDAGDTAAQHEALADLHLALAQWAAGELFARDNYTQPAQERTRLVAMQRAVEAVESELRARFPRLLDTLRSAGITPKKALTEFPKWAQQNSDARLADAELAALAQALRAHAPDEALRELLDAWMDQRSPRWLMGWRDICRSTDERTVIAAVVPMVGVGNKIPLFIFSSSISANRTAALLANLSSLVLDFAARQKIGGTTLNYFYMKQFPLLPPDRYTAADLPFIIPRVLELTYTADDLRAWAEDLAAYDPRPAAERARPFGWNPERRAQLRAELDAYYARLYGLTRDELRYLLDPGEVMGADYPSETFRVLKEGEIRTYGEYRTRRLVLEAWDELHRLGPRAS